MTRPDDPVEPLPCGRDPLVVVDAAREGRVDDHSRSCPYCQGVIDADRTTRVGVARLAVETDEVEVPDTLLPAVMDTVWSDLRRARMIPLPSSGGTAFVADHAVAGLVERAVADLADLQVRTGEVESGAGPAAVTVVLRVAVAFGCDIRALAARVRTIVTQVTREQFGLHAERVDLVVVDVLETGGQR